MLNMVDFWLRLVTDGESASIKNPAVAKELMSRRCPSQSFIVELMIETTSNESTLI